MNRNTYTSDFSVPPLSLASSRSKKNIPTKDVYYESNKVPVQIKQKPQVIDRINRPPIFSSRVKESKISIQKNTGSYQIVTQSRNTVQSGSLNRNVYLNQEQHQQAQLTFRPNHNKQMRQQMVYKSSNQIFKSPSTSLLRNPESNRLVGIQIENKLQSKKLDANKALFQRRIKKLFQQADFYDKQLMQMYPDNSDQMAKQLLALEKCRKDALSFDFGSNLIGII